jgi:penicillin-binding protein 1C
LSDRSGRRLGRLATRVAVALAALLVGSLAVFRLLPAVLPYAGQGALGSLEWSRVVLDRAGGVLQTLPVKDGLRRLYLGYEEIPKQLVQVVVGAEDQRFWVHPGFDPAALVRAVVQNRRARQTVSGASTISMQLARILRPRPRTTGSKIEEIWEAMQLESRLGKRGVLALYLDLSPFGRNAEGFSAAAQLYFGKPLHDLTREELMVLAVIPRSPQAYDPFEQRQRSREAVGRIARSLHLPASAELDRKVEAALDGVLDPARAGVWPFRAPHFITYLSTLPEFTGSDSREPFRTTIEPRLQATVEFLIAREVENASRKRITNGAALFVRPGDMTVAAYVGSADYYSVPNQGQVDGVQIQRQPGSTLKPLLYSLALENGYTASSILPDVPTDFGGEEIYVPGNFNEQFNGPVRLRQALAASLNVPAVATLERLGVTPFTEFLIADGFTSIEGQRGKLGLGLAIGNAEIRLWELVQGYGVFLQKGFPARLRVTAPPAGRSAGAAGSAAKPLVDPRAAELIRDILIRFPDHALVFGRGGNTRLRFEGAMKTGTSNQANNIWAVGFTPDLLGGIWMGNFSGATVVGDPGSGIPAGVLARVMEEFSAHPPFPPLEGLAKARICSLSGGLATALCPHVMDEWFIPGTEPAECSWHQPGPGGVEVRLPQEYRAWLDRYGYRDPAQFQASAVRILQPLDRSVFYWDPSLPDDEQAIRVEATGTGSGRIEVDGKELASGPFPLTAYMPVQRGTQRIAAVGEGGSDVIQIEVR